MKFAALPSSRRRSLLVAALAAAAALCGAAPAHAASAYEDAVLRTEGIEHFWRLGETTGTVAHDLGPRTCLYGPGEYGSQVTLGVPGAIAGDSDTAARFDGAVADRVWASSLDVPCSWFISHYSFGPMTLEAWVKPAHLDGNTRRIFSSEDEWGGTLVGARADGLVFSRYRHARTEYAWDRENQVNIPYRVPARWDTVKAPIELDEWIHVVAAFDGRWMTLIVDGETVAERESDIPVNAFLLRVGATTTGYREWDGMIDEAATYTHALTSVDAGGHYRAARAPR
jgi:hypothetical protein